MSRKIILVESCKECPFYKMEWESCTFISMKCGKLTRIPTDILRSGSIWDRCPLDDAEGFV